MLSGEELFVRCFFMGSPYTQRKVLTVQDRRVYRGICRRPSYQGSVAMYEASPQVGRCCNLESQAKFCQLSNHS